MKAQFTESEVAEMLDMSKKELLKELRSGQLGYSVDNKTGRRRITLYDLEKYMGSEHAMMVVQEFLGDQQEAG